MIKLKGFDIEKSCNFSSIQELVDFIEKEAQKRAQLLLGGANEI